MKRYAVAHMDFFNNDLKIAIVEANGEVEAIIKGMKSIDEDLGAWVAGLAHFSVEELKQSFFNVDRLVDVKLIDQA